MESEKVKEVKECLQSCNDDKMACYDCKYYEKCKKILTKNNLLTLIDELEEQNEWFKERQSKAEEIMKNGELSKITKQDMYYYYLTNCGYLEKEIERQKQIVFSKGEVIKQLKDRIAELESENERLNKALFDNLEAYKDGFNEGAELKKRVDNKLKNENQQLKDRIAKLEDKIENGTLIELPCKVGDNAVAIIDTLCYPNAIYNVKLKDLAYIVEDENGDVTFQHITRIFGTEAEAEAKLKELRGKV